MCRLLAYVGPPVLMADVVLWPDRSIIKQSYDARERRHDASLASHLAHGNLNGDGFGIGWFPPAAGADPTPCVYTSITPAWNNENLGRLARKISSPLVFAHVRAAMPGMAVNEQNCHPFAHGRYMWMHNGVVGGFMAVRRALVSGLSDAAYDSIQSFHSDSSVAFAVFLHHLPDLDSPQPPAVLLTALQATLDTISSAQAAAGVTETSLLNFAVSDGDTLLATRYVSSADPAEAPASLYYAEGAEFHRSSPIGGGANGGGAKGAPAPPAPPAAAAFSPAKPPNLPGTSPRASATASALAQEGEYSLTYGDAGTRTVLVASEPITRSKGDWVAVPRNTALVVSREKGRFINVMLAPLGGGACASGGAADVAACLEAVCGAAEVPARPFRDGRRMDRRGDDARPRSSSLGPGAASGGDETPGGRRGARATSCGPAPRTNDHRLTGHAGPVLCMAQRGNLVFSGSVDRTVKVWDLTTFECVRTLAGHGKPVQRLAVAGHLLYSAGGRRVRAWDVRTWACVHELALPEASGSIFGLAVCDAGVVYVAGQDAVVRAYKGAAEWLEEVGGTNGAGPGKASVACPAPPLALSHMPHPIEASARSPPGGGHCSAVCSLAVVCGLVCSAGGDATIRVWREGSLAPVGVLRGHRGSVLTLFALRGLLLSGGRDNIIRVWDLDGMLCRQTLAGHQDDVLALSGVLAAGWDGDPAGDSPAAFEARASAAGDRGALFASASADGTVRVWSAERWACVRVLAAGVPSVPGEAVTDLPFLSIEQTPDAVVAGASDGQLRVWALDAGNAAACARPPSVAAYDGARPAKRVRSAAVLGPPAGPVRLDAELERSLREFVRLRTVSADPSAREACFRGAKFLARQLESLGAEIKLVRPADDRNPVVLGRLGRNPALPTVTFYGHYDVQPAMEREWATDPFEVCSVDGYLYGRGTSDNKGPILAFLYAVKELIAETGSGAGGPQGASPRAAAAAGANGATAPSPNGGSAHAAGPPPPPCPTPPPPPGPGVNVAFVFEGEEENGSGGFREAVASNAPWFEGTRLVVISNTLWVGERVPCLTYGMRGMISASIEVRGPARDLHSGNDGGVFHEPLSDLAKVLASLAGPDARVAVPGFYDAVRPGMLHPALARLAGSSEFDAAAYRAALGLPAVVGAGDTAALLDARWCAPTLSVCDVRVGDEAGDGADPHYRFGPTRFSVIPRSAVGNVSIRFVPDQDAGTLIAALRAHVDAVFATLSSSNSVTVRVKSVGDWWDADPDGAYFRMAEAVLEREWGVRPLFVREGGTMPVASALQQLLNAPALLVPFGQASDACHLANERLKRANLMHGKNVVRQLLQEVAAAAAAEGVGGAGVGAGA